MPSARGHEGIGGFSLAVADRQAVLEAARAQRFALSTGAVDAFGARTELRAV